MVKLLLQQECSSDYSVVGTGKITSPLAALQPHQILVHQVLKPFLFPTGNTHATVIFSQGGQVGKAHLALCKEGAFALAPLSDCSEMESILLMVLEYDEE
jgi:hypothetical protein